MTRYLYSLLLAVCLGLPAHAVVGPQLSIISEPKPAAKIKTGSAKNHDHQNEKKGTAAPQSASSTKSAHETRVTTSTKPSHDLKSVATSPSTPAAQPAHEPKAVSTTKATASPSLASNHTAHSSTPAATSARASGLMVNARNSPRSSDSSSSSFHSCAGERLARVTAYWAGEGDYYTGRCLSSTGVRLHDGHCAVDPSVIPYGSVVQIAGVGQYLAVDTGSAVISREAAREAAHNPAERRALVIDVFFESRRDGESFAAHGPKYAAITWSTPDRLSSSAAKPSRHLLAEEESSLLPSKQL